MTRLEDVRPGEILTGRYDLGIIIDYDCDDGDDDDDDDDCEGSL